jgi:hypothetical protein
MWNERSKFGNWSDDRHPEKEKEHSASFCAVQKQRPGLSWVLGDLMIRLAFGLVARGLI